MQTLIIVMIVLLIAFTGVMVAICRIEAEEDERMMGTDEDSNSEPDQEDGARDEG